MAPQSRRMEGRTCVFCGAPSSRDGEHVWPMWFIRMFHGQGPFHLEVDGQAQYTKRGDLRTATALPGARVPCCEPCNRLLNSRFECAKDIIRPAAERHGDRRWIGLSTSEITTLTEWVMKVGLLSKHPDASFDDPVMNERAERWDSADPELYDWMVNGGPAPAWLTVFASFVSPDVPQVTDRLIHIPERTIVQESSYVARSTHLGVIDLTFDVLFHPMRLITHPLPGTGAVEVSAGLATGADLQALVPRNPRDVRFLVSGSIALAPGVDPRNLPPLSESVTAADLLGAGLITMASM